MYSLFFKSLTLTSNFSPFRFFNQDINEASAAGPVKQTYVINSP